MLRIDIIYFDAGGGHRAAATALKLVIEQQQRPWDVRLVHLQEVLRGVDVFRKLTGLNLEDIYNLILRRGWTLGSPQMLRVMQAVIRLFHSQAVRMLERFWHGDAPDLVVSVVPNLNRALYDGLQRGAPGTPYVSILTDMADYPPHFWMERQPQDFICGTPEAVAQALALGHAAGRVHRVSGMILHPRFYERLHVDRAAERTRLGLDAHRPAALVLFGGYGSGAIARIAAELDAAPLNLQLILICGRNEKLRQALAARRFQRPVFVEGFTTNVPYYMALADFLIGKPGPGSISEALHMGLPVITVSNAFTLPQERFNAQWLTRHNLGIVMRGYAQVRGAVSLLLSGTKLDEFRANARALQNRAVFEIPAILETILQRRPA